MENNKENSFKNIKSFDKQDSIKKPNSKDKDDLNNDHNKMRFHLKDYFLFYFYKLFPNYLQQIRLKKTYIGIFSIEKILDIRNIIKKLHEIDKLKLLMLSKDQLLIFNHLPKPIIHDEVSHHGKVVLPNSKRDYVDRYDELKRKEEKTEIDLKLLNMMEKKAERRKNMLKNIRNIKIQRVKFKGKKEMRFN